MIYIFRAEHMICVEKCKINYLTLEMDTRNRQNIILSCLLMSLITVEIL